MLMLRALRHRPIALLWSGQALSAVGDEIYRVALIWLAVGLIGERAGYLASAQLGALFVMSVAGGHWADEWDQRKTMVAVDLLRTVIALVPVAAFYLGGVTLPVLFATALPLSAMSAFFDPALQATLPEVSPDEEMRQAATGLMGTTTRLARAVGPALIALLARAVPMIHFFTLDAASFAVSALSISRLPPSRPGARLARGSFRQTLSAGYRLVAASPLMRDVVLSRSAVAALWSLSYGLGLALMVRRLAPGDVRAFGWMVACYGVGNVIGALFVGNIRRPRPAPIVFGGYVWLGIGFMAMGSAGNLRQLGAACLLAAIGGPVNDVPYYDLVQQRFSVAELPRIFRFGRACETGASLLLMAASPALLRAFGPEKVIAACGLGFAALGAAGLSARYSLSK